MAKTTWNANRTGGGTYEFSQDAQGKYVLNSVGFQNLNKLNLPDLGKTTQTTKDTTTKDTAAVSTQTSEAFGDVKPFYYDQKGGGADQYTSKYEMTKDKSLATDQAMTKGDTFAQARQSMTSDAAYTGQPTTGDGPWTMRTGKADTKPISAVDKARVTAGDFINKIDDKSTAESGMQFIDPAPTKVDNEGLKYDIGIPPEVGKFPGMVGPQKPSPYQDAIMRGQRGVKYEKPGIPQKFTEAKTTALKKVNTVSNTLSKALGFVMDNSLIGRVLGSVKETPTDKHAKTYFNINPAEQGGRISGNPATDLYAGLNRVSDFGNLEKAGAKRIANREKTAAKYKDKWSQEKTDRFNATTNKFKNDQNKYKDSKDNNIVDKGFTRTRAERKANPGRQDANTMTGGGGNGGGSTRVICTELHSTGEMSTRDWLRDIKFTYKDLSKEHIKGYLLWAVPTVEHIKKYPTYRKFWKHIAQHRANDIAWRLNQGKFDLLGRIYAGIGEPLCWLIGKCVSDKQIKELELNNWRQA